jgi:UTP:GlnB (protein PII) uridylyltransferase
MLEEGAMAARTGGDTVRAFGDSMPSAYREAFTVEQIREHAAISDRRGDRASHLELWRAFPDGLSVLCVVADDRPGLLSHVCRVLVAHDLEVLSAQIYCRQLGGATFRPRAGHALEAFDLFWVRGRGSRRVDSPLDERSLDLVATDLESALYVASRSTLPPPGTRSHALGALSPPRVFFNTSSLRRGKYVLVVEALDCPGLLLAISLALHRVGVQILGSDVRTEGSLARDCFELATPAGGSFPSERLAAIRQAVVAAVRETLAETASG